VLVRPGFVGTALLALTGFRGVLPAAESPAPWRPLATGLEVAELVAPVRSAVGDSRVVVVRVDPAHYEFRLLSSKLLGLPANPTAQEWVRRHGLVGAINASMYREDHRTSVAYMRDGPRVNNSRWTGDKAVFAAAPTGPGLPAVRILDRTCEDTKALEPRYRILVQNIRMLDCAGRSTWAQQPRRWSTACVGTDGAGRVLLIHCRSPYSTHDLIEILRSLPLDLRRLMYVEGGPEASLYVELAGREVVSRVGSFETGFLEHDGNAAFWPIPNVIGFVKREKGH
jgi:phosphodiester glycosidase